MSANSDFETFGRHTELSLEEMTAEQRKAHDFMMRQRGQVPGPYKVWRQNPKLIEVIVPLGAYYKGRSSLSKAEIEIATKLTNGRWMARFAAKTNALLYSATAKELFMRVQVDPQTHEAAGKPGLIVAGRMGDDFLIDEDAQVLYLATHRQNTTDCVSMETAGNGGFIQSIVGDPFTENLIAPTSGTWGRGAGDYGRVAYFLADGGTASPPRDGIFRPTEVLRVQL